jgi:hypothetical protein
MQVERVLRCGSIAAKQPITHDKEPVILAAIEDDVVFPVNGAIHAGMKSV